MPHGGPRVGEDDRLAGMRVEEALERARFGVTPIGGERAEASELAPVAGH